MWTDFTIKRGNPDFCEDIYCFSRFRKFFGVKFQPSQAFENTGHTLPAWCVKEWILHYHHQVFLWSDGKLLAVGCIEGEPKRTAPDFHLTSDLGQIWRQSYGGEGLLGCVLDRRANPG